jgi:hypothetical protein
MNLFGTNNNDAKLYGIIIERTTPKPLELRNWMTKVSMGNGK